MLKEMVISATPHETRVAIMEDGQLCEIYVEREKEFALVGSIYKGRVTRVLPGMQSAFVEIGLDSDAFLYVSDFLEGLEEYDQVVQTVEQKTQKMEEQGGHVFAPESSQPAVLEPPEVIGAAEAAAQVFTAAAPASSTGAIANEPTAAAGAPRTAAPGVPYQGRRESGARPGYGGGDRSRQGRHGRRGGRGGGSGGRGDRHRGRELPSSKYASHRPYEPPPSSTPVESGAPGEPYEPIILPGESLAKYRDRSQSPNEVSAAAEDESRAAAATAPAAEFPEPPTAPEISVQQSSLEQTPAAEVPPQPTHIEHTESAQHPAEHRAVEHPRVERPSFERHRAEQPRESYAPRWQSSGGIEPLPGESIAKFRNRETLPKETAVLPESPAVSSEETGIPESVFAPLPEINPQSELPVSRHLTQPYPAPSEETSRPEKFSHEQPQQKIPEAAEPAHPAIQETAYEAIPEEGMAAHPAEPELTAEEANSLAEQVAEAQKEEEERVAEANADADAEIDADAEAEEDAGAEENGAEVAEPEDAESEDLIEAAPEGMEIGAIGELENPGLELAQQMESEVTAIEAAGIAGVPSPEEGTAATPLTGNPTQTTNARVREQFPRAHAAIPSPRRTRPRKAGARTSAARPSGGGTWHVTAPAAAAAAIDFRHAQAGPGNHRPDCQGTPGQKGRAHHQPRRAARTLPGLHAHARSHRRVAQNRFGGRALAPAPSGERREGQRGRRIHRPHRGGQRPAGRSAHGRANS